jgi:aminomethyltransferase
MGYNWMVSFKQDADFVGKDALRRIKADGPTRKLVGVEIGGQRLGSFNDGSMIDVFPTYHNGHRVGQVTSACHSPQLNKNIGYAMLPIELTELGTEVEVDTGRETAPAVVVEKPFVDPKKNKPKSGSTT